MRSSQRLASVAVSENCHSGTPKRRPSSSPTQAASSVGSIVVMPGRLAQRRHRRLRRVPGHRAGVAEAEVHVLVAVDVDQARAARLGEVDRGAPAHVVIQLIGTPASSEPRARSCSSRERG